MGTALAVTAVVLAVVALSAAIAAAVTIRRLRRPLLIGPGVTVPLRWRWSVSRQAVLHRRLLVAVGGVRMALPRGGGGTGGPWADLVQEVEGLALEVDRDLVGVEGRPRPLRQRAMPALENRVSEVEKVAARVVGTLGAWEGQQAGRSAGEIMERLDAIEGALSELDRLGPGASAGALGVGGPVSPADDERAAPG